jgi:hypothetical protein
MSAEIAESYKVLLRDQRRNPPCEEKEFPYTRYWGNDPNKPYCAKTIAGYWDATIVAAENALRHINLKSSKESSETVSVVSLQFGSRMYHGYGGEKHKKTDRRRVADVRHGELLEDKCVDKDTLQCHHETMFPWLETLTKSETETPFKESVFFFGPKTTADDYGEKKVNTVVVLHNLPSAKDSTEKSKTTDLSAPLYQIIQPSGTTITFSLTRDVTLVDIGFVENANKFLAYTKMMNRKQVLREKWQKGIFATYKKYKITKTPFFKKFFLNFFLKRFNKLYDELLRGSITYDMDTLYSIKEGKVLRTSFFEKDGNFIHLVRNWLRYEGLGDKVDGWFWGGKDWSGCSKDGLAAQEFAFFNPTGLLKYESHTKPQETKFKGIPTYDEFWAEKKQYSEKEKTYGSNVFFFPPW